VFVDIKGCKLCSSNSIRFKNEDIIVNKTITVIKELESLHTHLHRDVSNIIDNWEEDCCIGDVIKKYKQQLIEVTILEYFYCMIYTVLRFIK